MDRKLYETAVPADKLTTTYLQYNTIVVEERWVCE